MIKRHLKRTFFSLKDKYRSILLKIFGIFLITSVVGFSLIWAIYLRSLPSIEALVRGEYFKESTIIYDKNGDEIYSIFKDGKRTYIPYDKISASVKDAIISTEDGTFFENPWVDLRGIVRAGLNYIFGVTDTVKGTSTISQQLVRNTLLTNERSITRKIQEIYLSYKLNNTYTKEEILEMYLNVIPFGSNANGIEQASRTFFGKSALEVWPLWASILAALPKWPTYYSPYARRDRLMWFVDLYPENDPTDTIRLSTEEDKNQYRPLYETFKNYITSLTFESYNEWVKVCHVNTLFIKDEIFSVKNDGCIDLAYDEILDFIGSIAVKVEKIDGNISEPYILEYSIGRKDFVASQMLKEWKIDGATFGKILYDGLDFTFKKYSENIKYPYFVMYIKEYLEGKYAKDIDISNGLKVFTTIDPALQEKAEELVKKQAETNKKLYGASSAALISMDNKDGKLLAMVGGPDYFDLENGGNNNMTLALRQPGSSFKPFIYTLAISNYPIWPESPIADVETTFWKWKPDNYDRTFKGILPLEKALGYSRNIPAAKMFYLAGWEKNIVKIGKELGLSTLRDNAGYWAPMAIWTAEVRPIDLMQAYSVLANNGVKHDVYAIEKIEDANGNTIEEHSKSIEWKEVISPAASYIVTKILSNNNSRPESSFWRNALTINGRTVAAKTGTSNKDVSNWKWKGKSILPRDLWTAWYSPQITTVVWAGNVNGKETKWNCDGLNCAASIWKGYMDFALKNLPKEEFPKPKNLYTYNIVKSSGRLATWETPPDQITSTIMAVKLDSYDTGIKEIQIDILCNGPVSETTPAEDIRTSYAPATAPIIDSYDPEWTKGFYEATRMLLGDDTNGTGSITKFSDAPCIRPEGTGNITINMTLDEVIGQKWKMIVSWIGDRKIRTLRILQNKEIIQNISYGTGGTTDGNISLSTGLLRQGDILSIELIDEFWFLYSDKKSIGSTNEEGSSGTLDVPIVDTPPKITLINPKWKDLAVYEWDVFNLRFRSLVSTSAREISVKMDGVLIQWALTGEIFAIPIGTKWFTPGSHIISISVIDGKFRSDEASFTLTILPR